MISQTAEYALRAAVFLAASGEIRRPAREISTATQIPGNYLAKILGALARAGIVEAQRGPHGGFVLARDPREVTVLELVCAVEPWRRTETCPLGRPEHAGRLCALHLMLSEAELRIEDALRACTLRQLVAPSNGESCSFPGSPAS
ncbi:MAG: Rrf2 family transcriptional regulator [bacterium]